MKNVETLFVGGGISGLAAAWQLTQHGHHVELWEAEKTIGGKIATENNKGYTTERGASMVLNFRPEVSRFLHESGLDQHKLARTPTSARYLVSQGKLHNMSMKMGGMLFSPIWSLPGKLRLLAEPFILRGASKNESVADFIRRRLGSEMLDKAMSAYISGTLASDPELADSLAVLPHLTALERRYGSLTAGAFAHKFINRKKATETEGFSFTGGMTTMVKELGKTLTGRIQTGHKISHIERYANRWLVVAETDRGEQHCLADRLVMCTPAPTTARLLKTVQLGLVELLAEIEYASISVVHLGYQRHQVKHDLEGTGFLTPWREKLTLNGSMWMHSLFSDRAPDKHVLTSNYLGGARHPEIAHWSEQQKLDIVCKELSALLGAQCEPDWSRVDHHEQALPLYHGHYSQRQQAIAHELAATPGLYLHANYLGGVSIRDRIIAAQQLAHQLSQQEVSGKIFVSQAPQQACRA